MCHFASIAWHTAAPPEDFQLEVVVCAHDSCRCLTLFRCGVEKVNGWKGGRGIVFWSDRHGLMHCSGCQPHPGASAMHWLPPCHARIERVFWQAPLYARTHLGLCICPNSFTCHQEQTHTRTQLHCIPTKARTCPHPSCNAMMCLFRALDSDRFKY